MSNFVSPEDEEFRAADAILASSGFARLSEFASAEDVRVLLSEGPDHSVAFYLGADMCVLERVEIEGGGAPLLLQSFNVTSDPNEVRSGRKVYAILERYDA